MTRPLVALVAGTRPNFVKIAPLVRAFERVSERLGYRLIHTGQHSDHAMNTVFFDEFDIPRPDASLDCQPGSHAQTTGRIMMAMEEELRRNPVDAVMVVGDVDSTLAAALVAKKLQLELIHVEAGLRSGDRKMPEEINRMATDAITDLFFTTEPAANAALLREGHPADRIHYVGNVMIDNLFHQLERLDGDRSRGGRGREIREQFGRRPYGVVTLHRPANVDDSVTLAGIVEALKEIARDLPLVFPMHPRTRARCSAAGIDVGPDIRTLPPLSYMEFLALWRDADVVLTDSGGVQEESTALGVRCVTLRETTERPVTLDEGTNRLAGTKPQGIVAATRASRSQPPSMRRPRYWDGAAAERILEILVQKVGKAGTP
jgi:UDP-N-acetylglucosamine 2-epimerase (non-hydrolysing)